MTPAKVFFTKTLGVEFDPGTAWDEREQIYKASGKIIRTTNITQSAIGDKNGLWTSVLAAAVFVPPQDDVLTTTPPILPL